MDVFTLTFLAGEQTAYAPGYEEPDQRVWFASALTHDACHSRLYATGEAYTGRDAELECLMDQLAALKLLDDVGFMTGYVQGLIDGVDDPDNDYWNDPDRHW
jgi:predicted SprT family Zn-dependent metalloprotease